MTSVGRHGIGDTHICDHGQSQQEGYEASDGDEVLAPVACPQVLGEHVDDGRHEALNCHEL